ncbi:Uncharacterized conserved protein YloU, alkaline shock protein (Asp23) family [Desulfotomaculum arcticum]|uniref:Uncharacterized conserved protein YloU, alkaline shock protein (Asp23) family n=1 Tax=Desulfotruncus arcticus DSM 17038 TaxID=1121424 RepID=A0A1I2S3P1_9FIRM|nr:Asp23/Gls24 family envelope stress response protein [Desulfotruncus arcticus]SFG44686.1 Uncharacterized conserved protein YloU, alkaline shock protein (Asp23) family [Desulfotomaculum arcticum] [Desulfotruncus arcticus DSM 17038]
MDVYALVGPSGTGKSHRAVLLANKLGAEVIIDDGLVITGSQIVAGVSAKKQPTRIGAIKTALFTEVEHMKTVIEYINRIKPAKILLLGTSTRMVDKIAERLILPVITEYVYIEQIASEKEIRKARRMRTQHSKHVIPAPTIEVRKSLPETIINPLQVFLRRKGYQGNKGWLEQSIVRPTFTMYGKLSISQGALRAIATHAAAAVPGVAEVKRLNIIRSEQEVSVEIEVILDLTSKINETSRDIQFRIKEYIETMTGLTIKSINVTVAGVKVQEIV